MSCGCAAIVHRDYYKLNIPCRCDDTEKTARGAVVEEVARWGDLLISLVDKFVVLRKEQNMLFCRMTLLYTILRWRYFGLCTDISPEDLKFFRMILHNSWIMNDNEKLIIMSMWLWWLVFFWGYYTCTCMHIGMIFFVSRNSKFYFTFYSCKCVMWGGRIKRLWISFLVTL